MGFVDRSRSPFWPVDVPTVALTGWVSVGVTVPVHAAPEQVVTESSDAPKQPLAEALGRLLYLVHLAVLLWWLLDKSPNQRATAALVSLTQQILPSAGLALRVPPVRKFVISVDELVREALFGSPVSA